MQPGANVARIAREHGINDNLLFNWRHRYRQELICQHEEPELLPVSVSAAPGPDIHPTIRGSAPISSKSLTFHIKIIIYHILNFFIRTPCHLHRLGDLHPPEDCPDL